MKKSQNWTENFIKKSECEVFSMWQSTQSQIVSIHQTENIWDAFEKAKKLLDETNFLIHYDPEKTFAVSL